MGCICYILQAMKRSSKINAKTVQNNIKPHPQIRNIVAVASGKGGVGKSTVAVNVALALSQLGYKVGLLDADIYGPSQPTMLGVSDKPISHDGKTVEPIMTYGLQMMSIGLLVEPKSAMIWRGPMASGALQQLMRDTNWHDLDILMVDLPPGTGDVQLTMAQKIPIAGAIIVTTPQDIALLDVRRALEMLNKVAITSLGVVENMAYHICEQCSHKEPIFGAFGGDKIAAEYHLPSLGQIPLSARICQQADSGEPIVHADPQSDVAQVYAGIAQHMLEELNKKPRDYSGKFGNIVVE
jgi:ATP-binding protein involved in chromosome partitioning